MENMEKPVSETAHPSLPGAEQNVKELLAKYNAMRDDLKKNLDQYREISGLSPEQVRTYFEDPDNFTPQQWEEYQSEKKKYLEIIENAQTGLSESTRKKRAEAAKASPALKKARSKLRGVKQKWIPM
ncbi:MAG: hypothetical protein ACHQUC_10230 [Chlamydiales bacterium]